MPWSHDDIETLKRLWAEDMPASGIGAKLGKSRSAVLGMAHRMKLGAGPARAARSPTSRNLGAAGPRSRSVDTAIDLVADQCLSVDQAAKRIAQPTGQVQRTFAKLIAELDMGQPVREDDDAVRGPVKPSPLRPIEEVDRDIAAGRFK